MNFFIDIASFNENNLTDIIAIKCENKDDNEDIYVETDLFTGFVNSSFILLDCKQTYYTGDLLNIKYLKLAIK